MSSESDADQRLCQRIRAGEQNALGELLRATTNGSAGWYGYGWTAVYKGASTLRT